MQIQPVYPGGAPVSITCVVGRWPYATVVTGAGLFCEKKDPQGEGDDLRAVCCPVMPFHRRLIRGFYVAKGVGCRTSQTSNYFYL